MSKTTVFQVHVMFGDCDPAGIVFFPNFSKWMDASSLHFFASCGVPPWREMAKTHGIIGAPLLEIHTRFVSPATYGQTLHIHTRVQEWRRKVFVHHHRVMRDQTLLCEGTEVRAFCTPHPDDPSRIQAIAVPPDIQALCSQA